MNNNYMRNYMGNYMKIICLKEKYLAGNVYLCTQKQINNDDYGNNNRKKTQCASYELLP